MTLHKDAIMVHVNDDGYPQYRYTVVDNPEWISEGEDSYAIIKVKTKYKRFVEPKQMNIKIEGEEEE